MCKQMSLSSFKNYYRQTFHLQINHIYLIYMYKQDSALNNPLRLKYHKTWPAIQPINPYCVNAVSLSLSLSLSLTMKKKLERCWSDKAKIEEKYFVHSSDPRITIFTVNHWVQIFCFRWHQRSCDWKNHALTILK